MNIEIVLAVFGFSVIHVRSVDQIVESHLKSLKIVLVSCGFLPAAYFKYKDRFRLQKVAFSMNYQ